MQWADPIKSGANPEIDRFYKSHLSIWSFIDQKQTTQMTTQIISEIIVAYANLYKSFEKK